MADYTDLKRLAEAAQYENCAFQHELVAATKAFFVGCIPEQILSLIAERDQLKAENEALRKNAERYQWLREARSGYIEVVEWIGPHATGMTGEDLDALLDAAMGRGEGSWPT